MGQALFATKKAKLTYEPLGVIGVISPWNYPWSIPFDEVVIALAAGNGVVLKPASLTPLLGERIREVLERAGIPEGLVRVVHGGGKIGEALCEAPSIAKVFFTGSVEVGRHVGEVCARHLKGSVLELGGKDPQIVCADADLANAVSGRGLGRLRQRRPDLLGDRAHLRGAGRRRRVPRGRRRRDQAPRGRRPAPVGTPRSGPMVSEDQYEIVVRPDRRRRRARRRAALRRPQEVDGFRGKFIAPTVLTGVDPDMRIMREEIFGPVLPITVVADEAEALERANDSQFGLGASVWTRDRAKGERIARRIESGMVWINDHSFTHAACQCSWGGVKESGHRALALEVRLLRVRERQDRRLGAGIDPRPLVAAVRPHAGRGAPGLGEGALRPQRRPGEGARRRPRAARQGHREDVFVKGVEPRPLPPLLVPMVGAAGRGD